MHDVVCHPVLSLVAAQHDAIVAIAVEVADAVLVLEVMVKEHGQKEVAGSLRASQTETDTLGQEVQKIVQERQQNMVLEYSAEAPHDKHRLSIVIEVLDVELVAMACAFGVALHIQLHALAQVVRATSLDTRSSRPDEPLVQMLVHDIHHRIHGDAVVHGQNLQAS